jgi:beta-galactosidase
MKKITLGILFLCSFLTGTYAQNNFNLTENFNTSNTKYEKIGRGETDIANSVLTTKNAYLSFGENSWTNYEIKFRARVPDTAEQVQICAGFRAANRDDRYILMLKGGIQKDLYLARLGYMGSDDFLALRKLDFQPMPGKWYDFKIQVAGNRIRVYLDDEKLPRIDVTDKLTALAAKGKITLGGSWITNEFDDLSIKSINDNAISGRVEEYAVADINKEALRKQQRKEYQPIKINNINNGRTEISLNGKWLFSPGYETTDDSMAIDPNESDKDWHVMIVPNFWSTILPVKAYQITIFKRKQIVVQLTPLIIRKPALAGTANGLSCQMISGVKICSFHLTRYLR